MTIIQLEDSVAAALASQASLHGLSLEDYIKQFAAQPVPSAGAAPLSGEALEKLLGEEATADVVVPGTFTRGDIYREHG